MEGNFIEQLLNTVVSEFNGCSFVRFHLKS